MGGINPIYDVSKTLYVGDAKPLKYNPFFSTLSLTNIQLDNVNISLGLDAGKTNHSLQSIAIGHSTGYIGQGDSCVAVGAHLGHQNQGDNSIAIGFQAGNLNQGNNCISLGYKSGYFNQHNNSIVLNALSPPLNSTFSNQFMVKPI